MITVSVCIGSACHKRGSYAILNRFKQLVRQHGAEDIWIRFHAKD